MKTLDYQLIPEGAQIRLGMIVLQSDVTIEDEFRRYFTGADLSLLVSRIPFEDEVTEKTLGDMAHHLTQSTALFPVAHTFDAIGYACTSGAMQIGSDRIRQLIADERGCDYVSDPMKAALLAFESLGARNIGYLAPYSTPVCATMIQHIESQGFRVTHSASFDEEHDQLVGRISPDTIHKTAIELIASAEGDIDALFIACTNMKCATVLDRVTSQTGVKALSSNKVLAWDLARAAGVPLDL